MVEFKANANPKVAILLDNQVEVTFTASKSVIRAFEALRDKELTVIVKRHSKRRSLSQNAYLWVLLNELAVKLNQSKEAIYRHFIKDYGVFEILPLRNDAVEGFNTKWGKNGLGWFTEDLGESKLQGFTKLIAYYGSSTYNSKEMTRLIDAVVEECKIQGIETLAVAEIMKLANENDEVANND